MRMPPVVNARSLVRPSFLGVALSLAACQEPQLKGTKAEVQADQLKVTLPAVPSFEVPQPNADGSHTVKEMRVAGDKFVGTEVVLQGVVVWVYDCAAAIRKRDETDEAVAKRIEAEPEQCRRPAFYIGDNASTPVERATWVVEVPRNPSALEKKILKDEVKLWKPVPTYALGDEVKVTGTWAKSSPKGESNTDGLLIYKSMFNVTKNIDTPAESPEAIAARDGAPPPPPSVRPPKH